MLTSAAGRVVSKKGSRSLNVYKAKRRASIIRYARRDCDWRAWDEIVIERLETYLNGHGYSNLFESDG